MNISTSRELFTLYTRGDDGNLSLATFTIGEGWRNKMYWNWVIFESHNDAYIFVCRHGDPQQAYVIAPYQGWR